MRHRVIATLSAVLALGCSVRQTPVRLQGDPTSIARLAGSWSGEYWGGAGGRGGSLTFSLRSGTDSLYGDVVMVDPRGQTIRAADPADVHRLHVASPQQLRIDFVAVRADSVRGTLEPYVSPDCECTATTTFVGAVKGDRIDGTFTTRSGGREMAQGKWEMKRTSAPPG
jgi:hypothetical protein